MSRWAITGIVVAAVIGVLEALTLRCLRLMWRLAVDEDPGHALRAGGGQKSSESTR
jgi:hypothetical protein